MERKIGEIFNYQDNLYQCIKSITCTNRGFIMGFIPCSP